MRNRACSSSYACAWRRYLLEPVSLLQPLTLTSHNEKIIHSLLLRCLKTEKKHIPNLKKTWKSYLDGRRRRSDGSPLDMRGALNTCHHPCRRRRRRHRLNSVTIARREWANKEEVRWSFTPRRATSWNSVLARIGRRSCGSSTGAAHKFSSAGLLRSRRVRAHISTHTLRLGGDFGNGFKFWTLGLVGCVFFWGEKSVIRNRLHMGG